MAAESPYEQQLRDGAALVGARLGIAEHTIAYQSRSGNPREPWLGPDIQDAVREEAARGLDAVEDLELPTSIDLEPAGTLLLVENNHPVIVRHRTGSITPSRHASASAVR